MSKTVTRSLVMITATILVAVIAISLSSQGPSQKDLSYSAYVPKPYLFADGHKVSGDSIIQTESFVGYSVVKKAFSPIEKPMVCDTYRAGIVNHHALAADALAKSARVLKACRPDIETLIIISPDHFYRGTHSLTTNESQYLVDGRIIATDQILWGDLVREVPAIGVQADVFQKEHGIAALIPFYAHEFTSLKIVPITVKGRINEKEAKQLIVWMKKMLAQPKTFLLISADMSHYLAKEQALLHDQKTLQALATNDAAFFASASDDYIDSGVQVSLIIQALENPVWQTMHHSVSTDYTNDRNNTTSYITGFWK